ARYGAEKSLRFATFGRVVRSKLRRSSQLIFTSNRCMFLPTLQTKRTHGDAFGRRVEANARGRNAEPQFKRSSMMSDLDRNSATFDRSVGRAPSAVIDQGLRSYMLHVYNYMMVGLAITGFAALGVYLLSVTNDASLAAKVARAGAEVPAQIRGGMFL